MEPINYESRIKQLEKYIRILKKKLERSEADRQRLENASELRESVLKNVIKELEESQISLEKHGEELENALTNLKSLQIKLIESEKMSALGVLVAGIAHEINNPVSFIYGNLHHAHHYFQDLLKLVELYQHYYPQPVKQIQHKMKAIEFDFIKQDSDKLFESMNIGAERICQIVKSLRTFSRLDEAEFKAVDIHQGIDSTLIILNNRLKSTEENPQGIKVLRKYGNLPLIQCYPSQLNQVFINIITNAIDALQESIRKETISKSQTSKMLVPIIYIQTEILDEDWLAIRIIDNGLGMDKKVISQLFNPFFTTKEIGKGTGLGLSICYQIIVELHRGKLDCYSEPEKGTEFVIQIPLRQSELLIANG
jgi:two-component system, NtrC family, sensor kinase